MITRELNRKSFIGADDIRYLLDPLLQRQQHLCVYSIHVDTLGEMPFCAFCFCAGRGLESVQAVCLAMIDAFLVVEDVVEYLICSGFLVL